MRGFGVNLKTSVSRVTLLDILRKNRAEHALIVEEAKRGYLDAARKALRRKLKEYESKNTDSGKLEDLSVSLHAPRSHVKIYDHLIGLLELSSDDLIELDAEQYRHMVADEWDWMADFLLSNSNYSAAAMDKLTRA
tara:strand:+ start:492 stop:899 length:408 start_codon:yes stop_codon:yes gene_type:complete